MYVHVLYSAILYAMLALCFNFDVEAMQNLSGLRESELVRASLLQVCGLQPKVLNYFDLCFSLDDSIILASCPESGTRPKSCVFLPGT